MAALGSVSAWTAITISLNSLADGSAVTSTTSLANGTDLDFYCDVSIRLGSFNPSGAPYIELHMVPLLDDGTTYADVAAGGATMVAALPVTTGASAKNLFFGRPRIPLLLSPGTYRFAVVNRTGTAFAASGNNFNIRTDAIV